MLTKRNVLIIILSTSLRAPLRIPFDMNEWRGLGRDPSTVKEEGLSLIPSRFALGLPIETQKTKQQQRRLPEASVSSLAKAPDSFVLIEQNMEDTTNRLDQLRDLMEEEKQKACKIMELGVFTDEQVVEMKNANLKIKQIKQLLREKYTIGDAIIAAKKSFEKQSQIFGTEGKEKNTAAGLSSPMDAIQKREAEAVQEAKNSKTICRHVSFYPLAPSPGETKEELPVPECEEKPESIECFGKLMFGALFASDSENKGLFAPDSQNKVPFSSPSESYSSELSVEQKEPRKTPYIGEMVPVIAHGDPSGGAPAAVRVSLTPEKSSDSLKQDI